MAKKIGFDAIGIVPVAALGSEARAFEQWLQQDFHGDMRYMKNHFEKRVSPDLLFPGAKTVISCAVNYFHRDKKASQNGKISIYAQSLDYHFVVKQMLNELLEELQKIIGQVQGQAIVDTAPFMDKVWAVRAGIGWRGKHTNLINRKIGSYFFIGSLLLDAAIPSNDSAQRNFCGSCTACIDSCPTKAIVAPYQIDARKCIAYLNIESKPDFNEAEKKMLGEWLFGCDICQQVCPWNRFVQETKNSLLQPKKDLANLQTQDFLQLTKSSFKTLFNDTVIFRTGLRRMKRNATAVSENIKTRNFGSAEDSAT
ncbi:domain of unknown function DUF1730 [Chloroherpeton thalassium ATCC 35110]|uniref:4Fe-4S ferredoxin-type domain-containing protein n=1 Tax=Chloroherpeton thalassium (strain ATCC 35110 / GB-78) TaxID=517418 RepID=B3QWB9_CHLT3|nr:tRNA epoxyqueuosine(34) reductase QueG [Chloroherpeton thalassium]ACF13232.1 domain of unknown function DUF1730 [Chloroherpeton thalassium ATCC 35110]